MNKPPSPAPERPRKRPRTGERNRKKPDVLANVRLGLMLVLAAECLRVAFWSPHLRIREVRVSGTRRYTSQDLIRLGGIPVGRNLFRVNLTRVAERLEAEPALKDVTITREFPSGLRVDVKERVPAFQVTSAGIVYNADVQGVLFEAAPPNGSLPMLALEIPDAPAFGKSLDREIAGTVTQCVHLAREEKLALPKMRVDASRELWLNVSSPARSPAVPTSPDAPTGLDVRAGRMADLPEKFRDIRECLSVWPDLAVTAAYLNVMSPGNPSKLLRSAVKEGEVPPGIPMPGPAQAAAADDGPDHAVTESRSPNGGDGI